MDLFLFDILTILLIIIDMHNYRKQITPLTIFGGVYICLINLNNLVISKIYSFIPINAHALWIIFCFFIIIFFYVNLDEEIIKKVALQKNMRFNIYLSDVIRQGRKA